MKKIANRVVSEAKVRIEGVAQFYDQDEYDELQVLLSTVVGMLVAYAHIHEEDRTKWAFTKDDIEVWFQVRFPTFDFKGRIDLMPTQKDKQLLVDHKALARIAGSYLDKLPLDSQLKGNTLGATKGLQRCPKKVVYDIIRKCKLRRKSQESTEEFCERIKEDYLDRVEFYFHRETLRYSKGDIEAFEYDLHNKHNQYVRLVEAAQDPLDPRDWPLSDHMCDEFFRTCPFQPLCIQGLDRGTGKLYTQYNK